MNDDGIELHTRGVRFGTFRCKPTANVRFTKSKINLVVFQDSRRPLHADPTTYSISISYRHVIHLQYNLSEHSKANCIFFVVSTMCADKIRDALGMRNRPIKAPLPPQEPYFDPSRPEDCYRFVVILLDSVLPASKAIFEDLFNNHVLVERKTVGHKLDFKEISQTVGMELLVRTLPNQFRDRHTDSPDDETPNRQRLAPQRSLLSSFQQASISAPAPPTPQPSTSQVTTVPLKTPSLPNAASPHTFRMRPGLVQPAVRVQLPREGTFTLIPIGSVQGPLNGNNFVTPIIPRPTMVVPNREYPCPYGRPPIRAFNKSGQLNAQVSYRMPSPRVDGSVGALVNSLRSGEANKECKPVNSPRMSTRSRHGASQTVDLIDDEHHDKDTKGDLSSRDTDEGVILCYPPPPEKGGIQISRQDLPCLDDGEFINDSIIDFYLKYIVRELLDPRLRDRVHLFNTFFWKRLSEGKVQKAANGTGPSPKQIKAENRYSLVKNWTKHVDIFDKDFVIVPVNEQMHWYVVVVCFPGAEPKQVSKTTTKKFEPPTIKRMTVAERILKNARKEEMDCAEVLANLYSDLPPPKVDSEEEKVKAEEPEQTEISKCESQPGENNDAQDVKVQKEVKQESEQKENGGVDEPVVDVVNDDDDTNKPSTSNSNYACYGASVVPTIIVFDSLTQTDMPRYKTSTALREYFTLEWKHKKHTLPQRTFDKETMKALYPRVPQQDNWYDCGVFLLEYVERFLQNPPTPFIDVCQKLNKEWFEPSHVSTKREEIKKLLIKLSGLPEEQLVTDNKPVIKTEVTDDGGDSAVASTSAYDMRSTASAGERSTGSTLAGQSDPKSEPKRKVELMMSSEEGITPNKRKRRLVNEGYDSSPNVTT